MTRFSRVAEKFITAVVGACVLLSTCPAVRAGDDLGRLFFTPERRQQLDRQREMNLLDKQQAPADPTLTVDGVVTRSSGKRTAWVNGNPQHENDAWSGPDRQYARRESGAGADRIGRRAGGQGACRRDGQPQHR
jgi:hypothetical protein